MKRLWQGNVNAWECDELGHMNVMPYVTKALLALGRLSQNIGMSDAFGKQATATLSVKRVQIRYLSEARAGAPLHIDGGIERHDETSAEAILVMTHSQTDQIAATIRLTLEHIHPHSRIEFTWPSRVISALSDHTVTPPGIAKTRGLRFDQSKANTGLDVADRLGLTMIGMGMFQPDDMDVFGHLNVDRIVGRVSDSVIHFRQAFPEEFEAHGHAGDLQYGGVLLEANLHILKLPRVGDGYVIRSGLVDANENVRHLVHWGLDPVSGEGLWTMEGIAGIMDLEARKLIKASPDRLKSIQTHVVDGLTA